MALSGIEIYKLLPKTNCKDCGVPTCMAFAMKLSSGQAELSQCPHVSEESKAKLSQAAAPPIRTVNIGSGERIVKIGGETVQFRHEKTFYNPTGIALRITDKDPDSLVEAKLNNFNRNVYERVGLKLKADLVLIDAESGNAEKFAALVQKVAGLTLAPLILRSENPEVLKTGLEKAANRKPLIGPATTENSQAMAEIAKSKGLPLIIQGKDLESLVALSSELQAAGLNDLVLDTGTRAIGKAFEEQVMIRRAVIAAQNKALGFPTITFPCLMTDDPLKEALYASVFIAKYAGIVTLSDVPGEVLFPLLLERMNIFTDPQRPMATSPGIYEINGPTADSPVLITTNFSLTYFIVSGEVENSKLPAWLIVFNTEGLSVVTAWAAGKFAADGIAAYVKKCGIDQKVSNQRLVIPGMVAGLSGELEEELAGWKIIIGPREAQHITPFLKELR